MKPKGLLIWAKYDTKEETVEVWLVRKKFHVWLETWKLNQTTNELEKLHYCNPIHLSYLKEAIKDLMCPPI